ncbi:MAG: hypothetical protein H7A21_01115 [Spirochaetales bacterium]|nr:hypothetical protein [Leptospiraceae bacterium]MCB1324036.1 hypothetical protein [Leptospiraceae bacterium]MCP5480008.1 hypothetical protein [Spirochaetales bacterium]MCP5485651.1 hypothetical protein [Spirochaetales bacterium]
MSASDAINPADLRAEDQVFAVGRDYIPDSERRLRNTVYALFAAGGGSAGDEINDRELLSEAVFWSIGELINNANKANNRWAVLRQALFQKIKKQNPDAPDAKIYEDIDYAIEQNQSDMLRKYGLAAIDLTASILRLIEMHKTNSFALSEKFGKKIDVTLRCRARGDNEVLTINVLNNSPITRIDKQRVEYNLQRIKEDLIEASRNPYEAAVQLYDKLEDHAGGGFGAGLRSIVLFLKEGYRPFDVEIIFSRLIQYRSAGKSTIFSIELPVPA